MLFLLLELQIFRRLMMILSIGLGIGFRSLRLIFEVSSLRIIP